MKCLVIMSPDPTRYMPRSERNDVITSTPKIVTITFYGDNKKDQTMQLENPNVQHPFTPGSTNKFDVIFIVVLINSDIKS